MCQDSHVPVLCSASHIPVHTAQCEGLQKDTAGGALRTGSTPTQVVQFGKVCDVLSSAPGSMPFHSAAGPSSFAIVATVPINPLQQTGHVQDTQKRHQSLTILHALAQARAPVFAAVLLQLQPHFRGV